MADQAPTMQTPKGRLSFPSLFEAKSQNEDGSGTKYFSTTLLFSPEAQASAEFKRIVQACGQALKKKFPTASDEELRAMRKPFRKCSEKPKYYGGPEFEGWVFCTVKSKNRPGVVDPKVQPVIDPSEVWSGRFARASVAAFAYEQRGNRGVSLWMNNVQLLPGGEPLAGGPRAQDEFTAVEAEDVGDSVDAMFADD